MLNAAIRQSEGGLDAERDAVLTKDDAKERFSVFEEYMLADDTPQYPMDPIFTLRFKGIIDANAARQALDRVIVRHPILRFRATRRFGRSYWTTASRRPEIVSVDYDQHPEIMNAGGFPGVRRLNLFEEPGFRVCHISSQRENWSLLVLQFHHSVADGLGIMRVIGEWMILYSSSVGAPIPDFVLPEIQLEAFRDRRKVGWGVVAYLRNFFHTWRSIGQLALTIPKPLVPACSFRDVKLEADRPKVLDLTLTTAETSEYILRAKKQGVTVNDSLLADFFLALDRWMTEIRRDDKGGRLRVMVPVSMRAGSNERAPLSNLVSTVFIDRSRRRIRNGKESLLKSVAAEMQWVKEREQHIPFLLVLRTLQRIPGVMKLILKTPVSRSTAVLSNLGRILEKTPLKRDERGRIMLGDACLTQVEGESPIRHKTSLSVVVFTYAGELNLCAHYDSRLISESEMAAFLQILRSYLFPQTSNSTT